jgi:hypothetical protein
MAFIAEIVRSQENYKQTGHKHLPGRIIKIFANPLMLFTRIVRRRDGAAKHFDGICNWLI